MVGVEGLDPLPGRVNYFVGTDPWRWRANVPAYASVKYHEVYPGVDLVYCGQRRDLEYDFVVAPGTDPRAIELALEGADRVELDADGDLILHLAGRTIRHHKPFIHQGVDGVRRAVDGRHVLGAPAPSDVGAGLSRGLSRESPST